MFANIFFSDVRDRYQRLSLRERLLVLLVLGVVFYFFFDGVVFDSQHRRRHELESSEAQLQKQIAEVSLELSSVARPRSDELERREQEYRSLKQKVEQLDAVLAGVSAETPKIAKLVGGVLAAGRHMGSHLPYQGSNLHSLHWKAKSQPLDHQGSPTVY